MESSVGFDFVIAILGHLSLYYMNIFHGLFIQRLLSHRRNTIHANKTDYTVHYGPPLLPLQVRSGMGTYAGAARRRIHLACLPQMR